MERPPHAHSSVEPQIIPNEALAKAKEELCEVLIQYANCPDPTKSAARKKKGLKLAEGQGEIEQTALNMVISNLNSNIADPQTDLVVSELARTPAMERLGPPNSLQGEPPASMAQRPSALQRIGKNQKARVLPTTTSNDTSTRKRLGRPPGSKNVKTNPLGVAGASTTKRKVTQLKGSPRRRVTSTKAKKPTAVSTSSPLGGQRPACPMILPTAKRSMDFWIQPLPAP